ncbi:hypothetical protein T05_15756 [Trichinella murrelli]|uniref:Uncharacterized protein n=1 Tax=Trichinella murrelli TaxID=144512 RepID=A0A0V0TDQ6_9BILA|nr:hypothetical protein T05_15756 [Trichinella murrelli]
MKLVPLATLVHMDIKAFPSRPSVPLLITNSIITSLAEPFALNTVLSHVHIIGYVKRAHFIHDSITLTSSEFDVSSDGPLKLTQCRSSLFTLRQLSSAGSRIDLSCGLCRLMKPVLMPTSVHQAFQWRFLDVPVCLYLSQISQPMALSNCVSYASVFPCHARSMACLYSSLRAEERQIRSIRNLRPEGMPWA